MSQSEKKLQVALVTGAAGFIGFHVANLLLSEGWRVIGFDCMSDYYDVSLKTDREKMLLANKNYRSVHENIEDPGALLKIFDEEAPEIVIHLAAQAGVRYSIDNPRSYLDSNVVGTFELLEAARNYPPSHLLIASTSSVYGANQKTPLAETDKADTQMSFYAATKKCAESMAHSYSHLFDIPITMFRFFTVYGPWGRPDMALFKFTKAILNGDKIDVYNRGDMQRDFTYIEDLVRAIRLLIDSPALPVKKLIRGSHQSNMQSGVARFQVVNIGNSKPEKLTKYIEIIEKTLDKKADRNLMPMQIGDIQKTWADTTLLKNLTGFTPKTEIGEGYRNLLNGIVIIIR